MTREHAYKLRDMLHKASASLVDEDALEAVELFPKWAVGTAYERGIRVRYEGELYRCEQSHTSQADWTPDAVKALWTVVAEPGEIPVWKQPTGAQDAYRLNDKVYYPEAGATIYISIIDFNTYAPDVYGWEIYHEEEK